MAVVARAASPAPHTLYVSNERSGEISVIDGASRTVVQTFPIGKRPRGIGVARDGSHLYVALSGSPRLGPGVDPERARTTKPDKDADGVAVVALPSLRILRKLSVGSDPEQFALSHDGTTVFVSNEDEAAASSWEIATGRNVFRTTVSEEPEGVALHPTRDEVYVTCEEKGEVYVLAAQTGATLAHFPVRGRPRNVAFLPDGSRAYVPSEGFAEVTVIDCATRRPLRAVTIENPAALPMGAVVSPDGRELFVSTGRGNTIAVIDTTTDRVVASIAVGQRPWGIALSPDGAFLYSANGGSNDVSVIEVQSRRELARIAVGEGPWGIAIAAAR